MECIKHNIMCSDTMNKHKFVCNARIINDDKNNFKYIVTQSPDSDSIECYKNFLVSNDIKKVIRLCEKMYDEEYLKLFGITVVDLPLQDGDVPDNSTISVWKKHIKHEMTNSIGIAVHCRAGLGRAPLFVCIGLISFEKLDACNAIKKTRKTIRGSLNTKQINFLCDEFDKVNSVCIIM